jgi:hypothetical protein
MTDLLLASVAAIALLTMLRMGVFRDFPSPSKWLAVGLGAIVATQVLGWVTLTYLSRVATIASYASSHSVVSYLVTFGTAFAIVCMVIGAFVSRRSVALGGSPPE